MQGCLSIWMNGQTLGKIEICEACVAPVSWQASAEDETG